MVGYIQKDGIKANTWTILGTSFESTGSTAVNLNNYITGTFDKTVSSLDDDFDTKAPQIQIKNPETGSTTFLYYVKDAWDKDNKVEVEGWCTAAGNYATSVTIDAGTGFWFWNSSDCEVVVSGQVIGQDTSSVLVYPIWSLIANPFPQVADINVAATWNGIDATVSSLDDDFAEKAPQVQVRSLAGNTTFYYYVKDAWDKDNKVEVEGWCTAAGNYATSASVPAAQGFWFKPTGAGTVTVEFTK